MLDEPVAALDPLARREFLQGLMEAVAEEGLTVLLSSHLVAELERVCDYLVILAAGGVQLAGSIEEILRLAQAVVRPSERHSACRRVHSVIHESHTERQTTLLVRLTGASPTPPGASTRWDWRRSCSPISASRPCKRPRPGRTGAGVVIWLTWRQQRTETLIAALLLALVAALLVPTGLHLSSVYESEGVAACLTDPSAACREKIGSYLERWDGAELRRLAQPRTRPDRRAARTPFVLEFERGTFGWPGRKHHPRRWLAARLTLIAGAAIAASLVLTLLMTWWRRPLDEVDGRFTDGFDLEGLVPSAYTLFAAALVVALGVVLRRTAAAIGLAFVLFIAFRIGIANWARPNYQAPLDGSFAGAPGPELRRLGLPPGRRVPPRRRTATGSLGTRRVPLRPGAGQGRRRRLPRRARHRVLRAHHLPPRKPLLALPGNRGDHVCGDGPRPACVLGLVDPRRIS